MEDKKQGPNEVNVRNTPPFKLKDRNNRSYQAISLKKQFGFVPEVIIVSKEKGLNNVVRVSAVLTKEELEKEKKALKAQITNKKEPEKEKK